MSQETVVTPCHYDGGKRAKWGMPGKRVRIMVEASALIAITGWLLGYCWPRPRNSEPAVDFRNGAKPNLDYFKSTDPRDLYLDLMKLGLSDLLYENDSDVRAGMTMGRLGYPPQRAITMVGMKRLDNIQEAVTTVLAQNVPGDLIEAGAWKGGATIFMRAVLKAYNITDRTVWVADSFEGVPVPNPNLYPADKGYDLWKRDYLKVAVPYVALNFQRYGLYDDQVRFLKGWFKDTLPKAPIIRLAVLRIDGDLYESTMDALTALYDRVSPSGWIIIDDYGDMPPCRRAVEDFRVVRGIVDPLHKIDWTGAYWIKSRKEGL